MEHSTQYKQFFIVTWVNISDALLCLVYIDAWKCVAQLAVKRLIYAWNLWMESMVLQIMGSNYHAHLKYFGITNRVVFGVEKKLCKFLLFKYVFDFAKGPLLF